MRALNMTSMTVVSLRRSLGVAYRHAKVCGNAYVDSVAAARTVIRPNASMSRQPVGAWFGRRLPLAGASSQSRRMCAASSSDPSAEEEEPSDEAEATEEHETADNEELDRDAAAWRDVERSNSVSAAPAMWTDPGSWVDLELERAGLDADGGEGALESPWGTEGYEHPDFNVLWPHRTVGEHRSRPFSLPRRVLESGESAEREAALGQVTQNRERLCSLWRLSRSHGISWDELDQAYVRYAQAGKQRYNAWARPGEGGEIMAVREKHNAKQQVTRFLKRFCPKGENPAELYPSRTKRLASRVYRKRKKEWLAPWRPGKLASHLQQLVAARMLRRETEERALHLDAR
eukprot:TRINITY_DN16847_c0_g1_i1.p1 TRINITY_DN16847_c0_g1~~TRINITY_DN16847_c0_g1_i1.p1  ORF type:complete len:346 (-),score=40.74 TRINITY_DN16847_c0_g1_i1:72-1109(-)